MQLIFRCSQYNTTATAFVEHRVQLLKRSLFGLWWAWLTQTSFIILSFFGHCLCLDFLPGFFWCRITMNVLRHRHKSDQIRHEHSDCRGFENNWMCVQFSTANGSGKNPIFSGVNGIELNWAVQTAMIWVANGQKNPKPSDLRRIRLLCECSHCKVVWLQSKSQVCHICYSNLSNESLKLESLSLTLLCSSKF